MSLLLRGKPWPEVNRRSGVPRSSAYACLHTVRTKGPEALLKPSPRGRPKTLPSIVRQRFDYLCRLDPRTADNYAVYSIDREMALYRVLKLRYSVRQLTRWYRRLVQERGVQGRFRKFRSFRRAYPFLRQAERDAQAAFFLSPPRSAADMRRFMLLDNLTYLCWCDPTNRELQRRRVSVEFKIPRNKVAFGREPIRGALFATRGVPDETWATDFFAPQPKAKRLSKTEWRKLLRSLE